MIFFNGEVLLPWVLEALPAGGPQRLVEPCLSVGMSNGWPTVR